jgi:outer membrane protein assembly factor BamB
MPATQSRPWCLLADLVRRFALKSSWGAFGLLCGFGLATPSVAVEVGEKIWEFETEGAADAPSIGPDGTVYVGSHGRFYALEGKTGKMIWDYGLNGQMEASPVVSQENIVYFGSVGRVYALDGKTGATKWAVYTAGNLSTPLTMMPGNPEFGEAPIIFVGSGQKLYALDGWTGEQKWLYNPRTTFRTAPSIAFDGTIYVGGEYSSLLYSINGKTGEKKWSVPLPEAGSSPAIGTDGTVYIGGAYSNRYYYAFDGETGTEKWKFYTGGGTLSSPAIGPDGTVYFGSTNKKFFAVDGQTGVKKWELPTISGFYSACPAVSEDGTVHVGVSQYLYALDGQTGEKKWQFDAGGGVRFSPAIGLDGTIYIGCSNKKVYAIQGSSLLARESPWPMYGQNASRNGQMGKYGFPWGNPIPSAPEFVPNTLLWDFPVGTTIGTISAGFNGGRSHLYDLTEAAQYPDNALFKIVGDELRTTQALDLDTQPEYTVKVKVTNDNGLQNSAEITFNIIEILEAGPGAMNWKSMLGDSVASTPAIGPDGTVYVGSRDNNVYALDGSTGERKWTFQTKYPVDTSPAVGADGTVYIAGWDGVRWATHLVYALNGQTGYKKWEFKTNGELHSSPAIGADGTVYVGGGDYRFYALDGANGTKKWEFQAGGLVNSSPAIAADGTVYFSSQDGKVYALDSVDGKKKWEKDTEDLELSAPAIGVDGTVYVGGLDPTGSKVVIALRGDTGVERWKYTNWTFHYMNWTMGPPVIGADGTVYVGARDRYVYALDGRSGSLKWEFWTKGEVWGMPAIGSDGTLYVGSDNKKIFALDSATGEKKWEFLTLGAVRSSPVIDPDGNLYFGSFDKNVYSIPVSSGPPNNYWPMSGQDSRRTGLAKETISSPYASTPTDISLARAFAPDGIVPENSPVGTVVGTFSAADPDAGDSHIFTLVDSSDDYFKIVGNTLKTNKVPDYETTQVHSIIVKATDRAGWFINKRFLVWIGDVQEAPTEIHLSPSTLSGDKRAGSVVGELDLTDPEGVGRPDSLSMGLLSYFPFNGNAQDESGNGNHPSTTRHNLTHDRFGNADRARLFGDPMYVGLEEFGKVFPLQLTQAAWVKPNSRGFPASNGHIVLFTKRHVNSSVTDNGQDWLTLSLYPYGNGLHPALILDDYNRMVELRPLSLMGYDKWSHVCGVKDGNVFTLYLNGRNVLTRTVTNFLGGSSWPMAIGYHGAWESQYKGVVDDVRIYDRAITKGEVEALYYSETVSYSLTSGTGDDDNASFTIDNHQLKIKAAPDFSVQNQYKIRIKGTDPTGLSIEKAFTLGVENPDPDSDGLPDSWELQIFGGLGETGDGDFDRDGQSNLLEYLAGTDPTNGAKRFRIEAPSLSADTFTFTFEALSGRTYRVETRTPEATGWTPDTSISITTGRNEYTVPLTGTARFYRIVVE